MLTDILKEKVGFIFPFEKLTEFKEQLAATKEKFTARMGKKKKAEAPEAPAGDPQAEESAADEKEAGAPRE